MSSTVTSTECLTAPPEVLRLETLASRNHSLDFIGVNKSQHEQLDLEVPQQISSDADIDIESPIDAVGVQEKWNNPRGNIPKVFATFFSLFNLGMNDASYGALIPYILKDKDYPPLSYFTVSLIFVTPFVGYTIAAFLCDKLHTHYGQRGVAILSTITRIVPFIILSVHPPYPVVVSILALGGLGNGFLDAGWNAWIANLANGNELLGFLHGFYGLGATLSPLIATAMVTQYGLRWNEFYIVMASLVTVEFFTSVYSFWEINAPTYRRKLLVAGEEGSAGTRAALRERTTWITAFFLLAYVGSEVSLGGWIVNFMLKVRHGTPFESGIAAVGFWLGITIGRVTLGFITPRIGERVAITTYLVVGMGLELLFWLVPQFVVGAVAVAFLGFFMGPLFPGAVIAVTKLLPKRLHVGAVGFSTALGGGGAAIVPFAVGAIANATGPQTLQPIIFALLGVQLVLWLLMPRIPRHSHAD